MNYSEFFTNNNSPSPTPSITPSITPSLTSDNCESIVPCPGPSPCPTISNCSPVSPSPTQTVVINELDKENTLQVEVPNMEHKIKILNFLKKILNKDLLIITYKTSGNNLLINLRNVFYKQIDGKKLLNIRKFFKNLYLNYYNEKLKKNLDQSQIIVEFIPGSLIIFIKIHDTNKKFRLTNEEKDLLEYYNFQRVFFRGLLPLSEYEYIQTRQNYLSSLIDEKE